MGEAAFFSMATVNVRLPEPAETVGERGCAASGAAHVKTREKRDLVAASFGGFSFPISSGREIQAALPGLTTEFAK